MCYDICISVQFSHSVMSSSLWSHGLQHARLPYSSPTSGAYSNYVYRVSDAIQPSHPLSSPSPAAFNLSQHQFFASGGQIIYKFLYIILFIFTYLILLSNFIYFISMCKAHPNFQPICLFLFSCFLRINIFYKLRRYIFKHFLD